MCWKHVIALFDVLDDPAATGERVLETFELFEACDISTSLTTIEGARGRVDFVHILIPGKRGRTLGGDAPTLGIIGRLGGIRADRLHVGRRRRTRRPFGCAQARRDARSRRRA